MYSVDDVVELEFLSIKCLSTAIKMLRTNPSSPCWELDGVDVGA